MNDKAIQDLLEAMKDFREDLKMNKEPENEWEIASEPFRGKISWDDLSRRPDYDSMITLPTKGSKAKPLKVFKTDTFLDLLFLDQDKKTIKGIPEGVQLGVLGTSGSGKSILMEEIGIRAAAKGIKTLYITSEDIFISNTPRYDLQSRMMSKAKTLGLDWNSIKDNLVVMDTVANPELRDWNTFAEVYRYIAERHDVKLSIIDSVTILETYRGSLKYRVMELARFNQVRGITCIMVNQRVGESFDKYDVAGGMGIIHGLDATVLVDRGRVYYGDQISDLGKRGAEVYMVRVTDCRLCGFVREHIKTYITNDGFLRVSEEGLKILKNYE